MTWLAIRYSVGNEHDPGDPWGRSELVIYADGGARLDHHFSRDRPPRAWAGHIDAAALDELLPTRSHHAVADTGEASFNGRLKGLLALTMPPEGSRDGAVP